MRLRPTTAFILVAASFTFTAPSAFAQSDTATFRLATWNVTNYRGADARDTDFRTSIYGTFNNGTTNQQSMSPDVFVGSEFYSQTAVNAFLNVLNTASGSPGDWAAAPFLPNKFVQNDSNSAFFYRTSVVNFAGVTTIYSPPANAAAIDDQPRDTQRYDFSLKNAAVQNNISVYGVHLKSGSTGTDNTRRLAETTHIRNDAAGLPAGSVFLMAGDMNVQSSTQTAYQEMVGTQGGTGGQFFDPINTPGTWNNNSAFSFVHTQDPFSASTGGMDDRHDQILMSSSFFNGLGDGFDYVGNRNLAYSTTTWNDPNHSYRAWGNDGTSFNDGLRTTGNTMVGSTIAQALRNTATGGGHLPVFLDVRYSIAAVAVPEPGTFGLLAFAGATVALPLVRRRKRA